MSVRWFKGLCVAGTCLALMGCQPDPIAPADDGITLENNGSNNKKGVGEGCLQDSQCVSGKCEGNTCAMADPNAPACEGPPGPCGDCDPACVVDGKGSEQESGFEPAAEGQNIVVTPEGAVTLDTSESGSAERFIWISNTGQGTVSKVNTRTLVEEGRYWSGPDGAGNDPSRTSVNSLGDVFIGNRQGGTVTKISSRGENCRDTTGDLTTTTSTGANDVKPWGEDDCVKWNRDLCSDCLIRAVAAQDFEDEVGGVRPVVWVGDFISRTIWKLDGETGETLLTTQSPVRPYGFALDRSANLWISGPNWGFDNEDRYLGRLDTNRCVDDASCMTDVCDGEGGADSCVKQRIKVDFIPYGMTVDFKQRVWLGGDRVARYDPKAAPGSRFTIINPGPFINGVTADDNGFIWGAAWIPLVQGNTVVGTADGAVFQFDAEDPSNNTRVAGTQDVPSKGVAVDFDGKIWSINQFSQDATIITPGGIGESRVTDNITGFSFPYMYSDMTGSQLRFATDAIGFWRKTFDECQPPQNYYETRWKELRWNVEIPDGQRGKIVLRVRAATSPSALDTTDWEVIAELIATEKGSFDLQPLFDERGWQNKGVVEVEAQLSLERDEGVAPDPPRLVSVGVTKSCPEIVQ